MKKYDQFEEERLFWTDLFNRGEIDFQTYTRNMDVINMRNNFYTNKTSSRNPITFATKIIFILVIIICCNLYYLSKKVDKNYVVVNGLEELSDPYQQPAEGQAYKIIDDVQINMKYVAEYVISGRVVKVYSYPQFSTENKLSPKDIGLSWGKIAKDENHNKITYSNSGNRFLKWTIYDTEWYKNIGSSYFEKHISNNHVIPSNDEIAKKIGAVKEDDFILLRGYLVNVKYIKENGATFTWNTSTTRSDTGNGACEVFYVTDIEWLEESIR